jgi:hypothetical protein
MLRITVGSLVLSGLLFACGGKSFDTNGEPEGGSGNSGGSAQAGTGSGAREGGGNSAGGTGSGGGNHAGSSSGGKANGGSAGAAECDDTAFQDEMGGSVPVRLINGTQHPIYLGQKTPSCGAGPLFQVADGKGQPLTGGGFCQTTCEMLINGTVIGCPAIACAIGSVITLAPGESTIQLWSTLYTEQVALPPACRTKTDAMACQRVLSAKPGAYIFSAEAGLGMKCDQPDSMSCASCQPNSNGGCATFGAVITEPLLNAKTMVELDASYGLGGPGGGGMVREVEVTFND